MSFDSFLPVGLVRSCRAVLALGALVAIAFAVPKVSAGETQRPNFVFIFADDLGYGDVQIHRGKFLRDLPPQSVGRSGNLKAYRGKILTPHIDRLAGEGTDFTQFTVCSPVCSPSRVAAMTGHFPSRHGVHQHFASHAQNVARGMPDFLDPRAPLLSRILRQSGYATGHYGKWHLSGGGVAKAPTPDAYGFDDAAVYTGPGRHVFDGTDYAKLAKTAQKTDSASYLSIVATDHALDFIRDNQSGPFYCNLWLHETHHVVSARPEDREPYAELREPYQTYYGAVTRADAQVGRVLDLLDELDLADNTMVIFSSDNGPEVHSDRLEYSVGSTAGRVGRKRSLMMGGVNVPFIVRYPPMVPRGRVNQTTALAAVDLLPTLCSMAEVPLPADYESDGEDISNVLAGDSKPRDKPLFWYWQGHHGGDDWPAWAVRDEAWGLVADEEFRRIELYDLVKDPYQSNDLADQEPERVQELRSMIEDWRATLPELPELAAK